MKLEKAVDKNQKRHLPNLKMLPMVLFFLIIICAFICSKYFYQFMLVLGKSMEPSYYNMQLVILDKRFSQNSLKPGDVIAFHSEGLDEVLVKRIAARSGQSIQIIDGSLFVDDIRSDLFGDKIFDYAGILSDKISLKDDEYIVIGDNIEESKDSRYVVVGIVQIESIIGRIVFPKK